ncbi:MAG: hypothetical protein KTR31_33770 [Myxococcales bacterium]|nr:hypothetical protein [Myxococcales bacterium]
MAVLVPPYDGSPGRPEDRPIGRAALMLEAEGLVVVFGHDARDGRLWGARARPGHWEPASAMSVCAAFDRFPSRTRPAAYAELRDGLAGVPLANAPALVELCADKLSCQRALGDLPMPEVQADPAQFETQLREWGAAFLKPRFGAFGRGVQRVVPGDALPAIGPGAVEGESEPMLLQRALDAPAGWAGVACRVLVQREIGGGFAVRVPVVRRSRSDPVVNAARGAEVVPIQQAFADQADAVAELAHQAAERLGALPGGDLLVEIGVDVVIDGARQPWIIEVNSRPRGRLEALARSDPQRFEQAHVAACAAPIRWLAHRFGG